MALDDNYEQYVDASSVSVMPTALRYGGIGALILIALGLLLEVTGQAEPEAVANGGGILNSLVLYGTIIGVVVLAIKTHRDTDLGGFISYGRSLGVGTLSALIMGGIAAVWTYVQFAFISPGKLDAIKEITLENMAETMGGEEEEALEMAQGWIETMFSPSAMAVSTIFTVVFVGFIIALIAGAILKKESRMA